MAMTPAERKRASRKAQRERCSAIVKTRRPRSDSLQAAVAAHSSRPPDSILPLSYAPVNQHAMGFWYGIISTRAATDWNESDLAMAAMLADAQLDLMLERDALMLEGNVVEFKVNPRFTVCEMLTKRITNLMRALKTNNQSAAITLANARTLEGSAKTVDEDDPHGLLA